MSQVRTYFHCIKRLCEYLTVLVCVHCPCVYLYVFVQRVWLWICVWVWVWVCGKLFSFLNPEYTAGFCFHCGGGSPSFWRLATTRTGLWNTVVPLWSECNVDGEGCIVAYNTMQSPTMWIGMWTAVLYPEHASTSSSIQPLLLSRKGWVNSYTNLIILTLRYWS